MEEPRLEGGFGTTPKKGEKKTEKYKEIIKNSIELNQLKEISKNISLLKNDNNASEEELTNDKFSMQDKMKMNVNSSILNTSKNLIAIENRNLELKINNSAFLTKLNLNT